MTDLTPEQIEERKESYRRQDEAIAREEERKRRRRAQAQAVSAAKRSVAPAKPAARPGPGLRPSQVPPVKAEEQVTAVIANPVPSETVPSETVPSETVSAETEMKPQAETKPTEIKPRQEVLDAQVELRKIFPALQIQNYNLETADLKLLADNRIGTVREAVTRVLDMFLTDSRERSGIKLTLLSEGKYKSGASKGVRIMATAPALTANTAAFSVNQAYQAEEGKLELHIESIVAKGRGKAFFRDSVLPQALRSGFSKLTLAASAAGGTSEGLIAWARYGFVPDQGSWDTMRASGKNHLGKRKYRAIRSQVAGIVGDSSPKALRRLIVLAWRERREGGPTGPGSTTDLLNRMLTTGLWNGEIDLTDDKSVQWLTLYLSVTSAEERLEDFEALLEPAPEQPPDTSFFSRFRKRK